MISSIVAVVIFISTAQAQIGDWQDVEDIPSGNMIVVQAEGRVARCLYEGSSDRELFCEQVYRSPNIQPRELTFDRNEIIRVTCEYIREGNTAEGALIGVGVGATAGAVAGENRGARDRLASGIVVGTIGGAFGALFARGFSSRRTKIVYQK